MLLQIVSLLLEVCLLLHQRRLLHLQLLLLQPSCCLQGSIDMMLLPLLLLLQLLALLQYQFLLSLELPLACLYRCSVLLLLLLLLCEVLGNGADLVGNISKSSSSSNRAFLSAVASKRQMSLQWPPYIQLIWGGRIGPEGCSSCLLPRCLLLLLSCLLFFCCLYVQLLSKGRRLFHVL